MSGIVGIISDRDCRDDLFYATDYHSHLGTVYGGLAVSDGQHLFKKIHTIAKAQFKSRFVEDFDFLSMHGNAGIGVISDRDTQPLIMRLKFGEFAICGAGYIDNQDALAQQLIQEGVVFSEMPNGRVNQIELVAKLINRGKNLEEGVAAMQEMIEGSMSLVMLGTDGIIAVRDKYGRSSLTLAQKSGAQMVVSETCSFKNLGFTLTRNLGPGEMVLLDGSSVRELRPPQPLMQLCAFLYVYSGFPASEYEGQNVEVFRERSGRIMARRDTIQADFVAGVADSGSAYAYGYAQESKLPVRVPLLKYTPGWARSYVPPSQDTRDLVALMKQITADVLIKDQRIVITEDSIVRGTQLKNYLLVKLWNAGARELHVRPACPILMFPCKFLFSTRQMDELFARRVLKAMHGRHLDDVRPYLDPESREYQQLIREMQKDLNVTSLRFQSLADMIEATGLPEERLCTYCWTGREIR